MALAHAFERKSAALTTDATSRAAQSAPWPAYMPRATAAPAQPTNSTALMVVAPFAPTPPRPLRHLTPEEMTEPRCQGLCFNCDKPYVRGHKCAHLFYLKVIDFDEGDDSQSVPHPAQDDGMPLISSTPSPISHRGSVHTFTALVNSGSYRNFISIDVARRARATLPQHHRLSGGGGQWRLHGVPQSSP